MVAKTMKQENGRITVLTKEAAKEADKNPGAEQVGDIPRKGKPVKRASSVMGRVLQDIQLSQNAFAKELGMSPSAVSLLINHNSWPAKTHPEALSYAIKKILADNGASPDLIKTAMESIPMPEPKQKQQEVIFTMRKQVLTQQARKHFKVFRDIFGDQMNEAEDVFMNDDLRYVRECLYQTALHGGFMALVGQSGSGKSTLRQDLKGRISREEKRIVVIEPYVLGMEGTGKDTSNKMNTSHICEAVLQALRPSAHIGGSPQARFKKMHDALKESAEAGFRHVLIVEEAHGMRTTAIKHLKRLYELEHGMTRLLSIILIAQPEIMTKLSENNAEVREVVQRLEILHLDPLDDVQRYVAHRCARAGTAFDKIFTPDAMTALAEKLRGPRQKNGMPGASLLYPLLVGNHLTKAMNLAAELGLDKVNGDAVMNA